MVTIPHRLFGLPEVDVLYRGTELIVLRKRLTARVHERPSYVSMHALSCVTEGEQVVYGSTGGKIRVGAGSAGLIRRGLYTVTDLLAAPSRCFETTLFFFSDPLLRRALDAATPPGAPGESPELALLADVRLRLTPARELTDGAAHARFLALIRALCVASPSTAGAFARLLTNRRRSLRDFMRAHFDKPLQLVDYAYLTGRSERSFRRDFKARFGESPKRWLVDRRLERARELLFADTFSVAEVAAAVGYTNTSHFIKLYRERYGMTPGVEAGWH